MKTLDKKPDDGLSKVLKEPALRRMRVIKKRRVVGASPRHTPAAVTIHAEKRGAHTCAPVRHPRFQSRRLWYGLVVLGLVGAAMFVALTLAPEPVENELPPWVPAAQAPRTEAAFRAVGRSEPRDKERTLTFPIGGLIERICVREGQLVKTGDTVAVLEHAEQSAALAQAEAEAWVARVELAQVLAGAKAETVEHARLEAERAKEQFGMLQQGVRIEEKAELEAMFHEAAARADAARRRVERWAPAYDDGVLTKEGLISARDDADQATQAADAAKARLEMGRAGYRREELRRAELAWKMADLEHRRLASLPRKEEVEVARARVKVAAARLEAARTALNRTNLRAPCDGTVLQILAQEGERVEIIGPSPVLVMGNREECWLRVEVDENDVDRVQVGQTVTACARGLNNVAYQGTVERVGRRMGRKRLFTDLPDERVDTQVLEVWVRLRDRVAAPIGYRFWVDFQPMKKDAASL